MYKQAKYSGSLDKPKGAAIGVDISEKCDSDSTLDAAAHGLSMFSDTCMCRLRKNKSYLYNCLHTLKPHHFIKNGWHTDFRDTL